MHTYVYVFVHVSLGVTCSGSPMTIVTHRVTYNVYIKHDITYINNKKLYLLSIIKYSTGKKIRTTTNINIVCTLYGYTYICINNINMYQALGNTNYN